MRFEWNEEKDKRNIVKHGIPFRTAILVFSDPDRIEKYDDAHSLDEDRYITIGKIGGTFMVVTVLYGTYRCHTNHFCKAGNTGRTGGVL